MGLSYLVSLVGPVCLVALMGPLKLVGLVGLMGLEGLVGLIDGGSNIRYGVCGSD